MGFILRQAGCFRPGTIQAFQSAAGFNKKPRFSMLTVCRKYRFYNEAGKKREGSHQDSTSNGDIFLISSLI